MDFQPTARVREMQERIEAFMEAHVYPAEDTFAEQLAIELRHQHGGRLVVDVPEADEGVGAADGKVFSDGVELDANAVAGVSLERKEYI